VFLGNLILHPERVRITKSQRVRHRRAARNDDSGTAFEVPAGLNWGYETFGLYPIVSLAFKFEQYAVVAERPLRQSFNL
jgi:hypothetical protein